MFFISLNEEKEGYFCMYCLSVYLIQIQSYHAFSKMTEDHWCLSLMDHYPKSVFAPAMCTFLNSIICAYSEQVCLSE